MSQPKTHPSKRNSSQPRAAARINSNLNKNLVAYMAAAGAAGVTLLAAQPAQARIVYTPANTLVQNPVPIDLNHDGTVDFSLGLYPGYYHTQLLDIAPKVKGNAINGNPGFFGVPVGPAVKFATNSYFGHGVNMAGFFGYDGQSNFFGEWAGVSNRYLGFKFLINGQIHYGWARVSVPKINSAVLTGYAYETTPNTPILEGHTSGPEKASSLSPAEMLALPAPPPSLGMLARGAEGFSLWRRDEEVITQ